MSEQQVVLAVFKDEAAADAAAVALEAWAKGDGGVKFDSVGILVLDDKGQLKSDKVGGGRSVKKGVGIGIVLAILAPVGLAAGIIGGGLLGALHHKGLGLSDESRARIGAELKNGKAAVGVLADKAAATAIALKLTELGGAPELLDLTDEAIAQVTAAQAEAAAAAPAEAAAAAPAEDPAPPSA